MKTFFIWLGGLVVCGFVGALIGEYFGERQVLGFVIGLVSFAFFKLLVTATTQGGSMSDKQQTPDHRKALAEIQALVRATLESADPVVM
jgi:uncharacterized membrane protein YfcA